MSTVINTNIAATRTSNIYNKNNANMNTYLSRVATGQKINSVKDNASQWAISEKMRERMNSLSQAHQNSQNDSALLKTAEGGISNTVDILRTLKARAINAADGTLQDSDRDLIQKEVKGLIAQIDDNANKVTYNGIKLLDGSASGSGTAATKAYQTLAGTGLTANTVALETTNTNGANKIWESNDAVVKMTISWTDGASATKSEDITATSVLTKASTVDDLINKVNSLSSTTGFSLSLLADGDPITQDANGDDITVSGANLAAIATDSGASAGFSSLKIELFRSGDTSATSTLTFAAGSAGANASAGALDFQVGDDDSFRISANLPDMTASTLGIGSINVSKASGAMSAMGLLDSALTTALSAAADVGALEQRLGYTADNLVTMNENLEASDSAIRDSDIAKDMTNYMKYAVLSQASQYMLAQAGQNAFSVLNLLQA